MPVAKWRPSGKKLAGFSCIELEGTRELCLAGARGDIWHYGGDTYRAIVTHDKDGKKLINEQLLSFKRGRVREVMKRLKVPISQMQQADFANDFSGKKRSTR